MKEKAILVLQDGTIFYGKSSGSNGYTVGEIIFNTAMTGYQEILTDPSYAKQLITFTYPHIGNVGVNKDDEESINIYAKGIIVKNISNISSSYRSINTLSHYLKEKNIIAISNIDTRKLTRIIRNHGTQYGCIQTQKYINIPSAIKKINHYKNKKQKKLTADVSKKKIYPWTTSSINPLNHEKNNIKKFIKLRKENKKLHVVVYDLGIKNSILQILDKKGCYITLVPFHTHAKKIIQLKPSGILLSNGPGDPRLCKETIKSVKTLLQLNIPIFGICLGHQILALAAGAKIKKMKFGHHGSNHPVQDIITKNVFITSQNHNFVINPRTINKSMIVTHISLFDKTIQGISLHQKNSFSFQGHPEAGPGTNDIEILFNNFIYNMYKQEKICQKEKI
ncbi:glutamine-hydrolyzing carbamoyl-phosphate synthase small subunit [Buchnera aphidicola]|uniref:glutamine-hydrolyzing carbamoyl-phosphate synthase small subunit n=1 Tax=Buchnera aphidicola TaxID=9 RepID=UPI00094C0B90|nr:glutamine-hydrolyzing carbamoyl-phosphate synthase small subunit [Buchnera aphidicola]